MLHKMCQELDMYMTKKNLLMCTIISALVTELSKRGQQLTKVRSFLFEHFLRSSQNSSYFSCVSCELCKQRAL